MADISLHDYLDKVNQLLDEEQLEEASHHCLHILKQFPRHVDTYRLLAKALLGQRKNKDAIELFQRILSADPNDLIAHIALSDLYRSEMQADLSRWHLQRAFEIEPYNHAIQEEIRTLAGEDEEDAFASERLPLSRAALANLYVRGELYQQATAVLRTAIVEFPDRIDLQLLLAEALWREGAWVEAADVCRAVLNQLPNSMTANAILSEIWLNSNRSVEAIPYLDLVQSLCRLDQEHVDPDTAVGRALTASGAPPLPECISLQLLKEAAVPPVTQEPTAEWVSEIPFDKLDDTPESVADFDMSSEPGEYDWLKGMTAELGGESLPELSGHAESHPSDLPETDGFVDRAVADKSATPAESSASGWLGSDWQEGLDDAGAEPQEGGLDALFGSFEDEQAAQDDEQAKIDASMPVPDWLAGEDSTQIDSDYTTATDDRGEMPDWLADADSDFEAVQLDPSSASAWLSDEPEAVSDSSFDEDEAASSDAADWLAELSGEIEELGNDAADFGADRLHDDVESGQETAESEITTTDTTDWLEDLTSDEQETGDDDWLAALSVEASTDAESEPSSEKDLLPGDADTSSLPSDDWLADMTVSDDGFSTEDDDWLSALAGDADLTADFEAPVAQSEEMTLAAEADADERLISDDELNAAGDDWLAQLAGEDDWLKTSEPPSSELEESDPFQSDDWLAQLAGDVPEPDSEMAVEAAVPEVADDAEIDDWLADLEKGTGFLSTDQQMDMLEDREGTLTGGAEEPSDLPVPDWLSTDDFDEMDKLEAAAMGSQGDEKDKEQKDLPEPKAEESSPDELMDWLDDLTSSEDEQAEAAALPEKLGTDELLKPESDELPDWLADSEKTSVADNVDIPDWLLESDAFPAEHALSELNVDSTFDDSEFDIAGPPTALLDELQQEQPSGEPEVEDSSEDVSWLSELSEVDDALDDTTNLDWFSDDAEATAALDWMDDLDDAVEEPAAPEGEADEEKETAVPDEVPEEIDEPIFDVPSDLDDAMSWLEDLAAEESAPVEPLPTVAEVLDEGLSEITDDQEDEDLPTVVAETAVPEEQPLPDEFEDDSFDDALADLDDAMAWLDEMAASPELLDESTLLSEEDAQPEVVEESDTLIEVMAEAGLPTGKEEPSTLDEVTADVPEDLDEAMAWLENLAANQGVPLEELPSLQEQEEPAAIPEAEVEDVPEPISEPALDLGAETAGDELLENIPDVPEDLDEAMAWLEELAARQGAPLEELPSLMESGPEPLPAEDDEDVAAMPDEVIPEPVPVIDLDPNLAAALDWLEETVGDDEKETETAVLTQTSDDELAEALEWLEQVALSPPSAPVTGEPEPDIMPASATEPLPGEMPLPVAEIESSMDEDGFPSDLFDMPEDPDDALAWLEEMSDERVPVETAVPTHVIEPETVAEEPLPEPAAEEHEPQLEEVVVEIDDLIDSSIFDMPEDPDEALAWLEEVSTDEPSQPVAASVPSLVVEPEPVVEVPEKEPDEDATPADVDLEADLISSVPEDPDEAMAWLEKLAARQGASLDELPTVSERTEDVETPDWITAAAEQAESLAEEVQPVDKEVFAQPAADFLVDDDVIEEMPSWLGTPTGDEGEEMLRHTDWLNDVPEPDVTGWLEAEAAASSSSTEDTAPLPETGPLFKNIVIDPSPLVESILEPEEELPLISETDELSSSLFQIDEDQLESARSSLTAGEVVAALSAYQELVTRGEGLMMLINELETAATDFPQQLEIRRLLGDAYMRNGQLQKALTTYREALDQL